MEFSGPVKLAIVLVWAGFVCTFPFTCSYVMERIARGAKKIFPRFVL